MKPGDFTCTICNEAMHYYFTKKFNVFGLMDVDYWRCENCGFVLSKTHKELSREAWENLNLEYHKSYQGTECNTDDPRWIDRLYTQAGIINDLVEINILDPSQKWLDFGCGDGKLSSILKADYNLNLLNFDRYMTSNENYLGEDDLTGNSFDFVITTSVFEHILRREDFDRIHHLVKEENGILAIHTRVCEKIPRDPDWFYLLPVHCAFHTNKSMSILFNRWGYECSVYNVDARLWFFIRRGSRGVEKIVDKANKRDNTHINYVYKDDFVDYWKVEG